jgi:hypothetical protein
MISTMFYRKTLKNALSHFIQSEDLAMFADIIMTCAFRSANSHSIIHCCKYLAILKIFTSFSSPFIQISNGVSPLYL